MTAREKFIARLKELGLYDEWNASGDIAGKVMDDNTIVLFVHYESNNDDPYNELHYPSFDDLWENATFKNNCMSDYFANENDKFVAGLARWLHYGSGCGYECPLHPTDVYFVADGMETNYTVFFKDDPIAPDPERLTNIIRELAEICGVDLA